MITIPSNVTTVTFLDMIGLCLMDYRNSIALPSQNFIIKDVVPILWFGDMEKYKCSYKKIVTVGLNPSNKEFDITSPNYNDRVGLRFPDLKNVPFSSLNILHIYKLAMNNYFRSNPYKGWFNHFETPLNILDSTYYDKRCENTSIHIDFCSPLATNPTWGRLNKTQKQAILSVYDKYFVYLLNLLAPDVLLMSCNQAYIKHIVGATNPKWEFKIKKGFVYRVYDISNPANGKPLKIVTGRNMHGTPFGGVSNDIIHKIFTQIKGLI